MLYMKSEDGDLRIVVLETANLEELKKGRPARTPDGSVLICWTPDPEWLGERILASGGDPGLIAEAIEAAAGRPQQWSRAAHPTRVHEMMRHSTIRLTADVYPELGPDRRG